MPALTQYLADYNASLPRVGRAHRQLRIRVVMHAGEVHYDGNGCFGEALDIAFRLLDAPGVKKALRAAADPLTLVISGDIYRTIVRHGYDGIDPRAFRPLIRVHMAGHRYPRMDPHPPTGTTQLRVTEITSYKHSALSGTSHTACLRHVPAATPDRADQIHSAPECQLIAVR